VPNVSIIIPAHNEERHIEKCLESLLAQDYQDIEIIIVDNGSSDNTPKIVERYVERFGDKVRLLRMRRNLGPGGGRNVGASSATGDILVFVDADMVFPHDYTAWGGTVNYACKRICSKHRKPMGQDTRANR
jgi:glycosyltransferase involved in cell wall biosynthesis